MWLDRRPEMSSSHCYGSTPTTAASSAERCPPPLHAARVVQALLDEEHIQMLPWPALCCNKFPVEDDWDMQDQHAYQSQTQPLQMSKNGGQFFDNRLNTYTVFAQTSDHFHHIHRRLYLILNTYHMVYDIIWKTNFNWTHSSTLPDRQVLYVFELTSVQERSSVA